MNWLAENWILVLLGGGMVAMHLFGHGHGGKSGKGGCCGPNCSGKDDEARPADEVAEAEDIRRPS